MSLLSEAWKGAKAGKQVSSDQIAQLPIEVKHKALDAPSCTEPTTNSFGSNPDSLNVVELNATPGPWGKVKTAGRIAKIFAAELCGCLAMVGYGSKSSPDFLHANILSLSLHRETACGTGGVRAFHLYRALPEVSETASSSSSVAIQRNVKYGNKPRNILDMYIPTALIGKPECRKAPVALFCHGGVWSSGATWHYAPMAKTLAESGVVTCVMTHTLYPEAMVDDMVKEVSNAITWVFDNSEKYGWTAENMSLIGHSSGGHLCTMALMHRAQEAGKGRQRTKKTNNGDSVNLTRMPRQCIAICGVYDIDQHYLYETGRGVQELSTMKRAIGGMERFDAMSPSILIPSSNGVGSLTPGTEGRLSLEGEDLAHRVGYPCSPFRRASPISRVDFDTPLAKSTLKHLPPIALISSFADETVPWHQSSYMYWRLKDAGIPVKKLVYGKVGHADFVIKWPTNVPRNLRARECSDREESGQEGPNSLPSYASDLLKLLKNDLFG